MPSSCGICGNTIRAVSSFLAIVLAIVFLMISHLGAWAEEPISREELQADITEAYDLLNRYHPNLTAHKSRSELDALYEQLLGSVPEFGTKEQAYFTLSELVGAVCDAHTHVLMNVERTTVLPDGWPWFEFPLIVYQGRLYIEDPITRIKEEVVSINNTMGLDIAKALAKRWPSDGCLDDDAMIVSEVLPISGNLLGKMIGSSGPYRVETHSANQRRARIRIVNASEREKSLAYKKRTLREQSRAMKKIFKDNTFRRQNMGPELPRANLDYRYSADINVAYLGIGLFEPANASAEGIDKSMRDIIKKNPDALIIDLSGNRGGSTGTARLLMAYLLPRAYRLYSGVRFKNVSNERPENFRYLDEQKKQIHQRDVSFFSRIKPKGGVRTSTMEKGSFGKPDYKGKIYVLLSPTSRSNSLSVAANLRRLRKAKLTGAVSATDTVTFCAHARGTITLQNTGFILKIPEICYRSPENRFNEDGTLVPDIFVDPLDGPLALYNSAIFETALYDLQNKLID